MDLHLPCEDPTLNDVVPIWNPTAVANAERLRLQGINFLTILMDHVLMIVFHFQKSSNL